MANSNIPPRSGFTINFLQNSGIIAHVQNNVIVESQASLIDMLNALPAKLHRDRLEIDCQEIFDNYSNYTQHAISSIANAHVQTLH